MIYNVKYHGNQDIREENKDLREQNQAVNMEEIMGLDMWGNKEGIERATEEGERQFKMSKESYFHRISTGK